MGITIEHNGHSATLEWREAHNGWKNAWWVTFHGQLFIVHCGGPNELDKASDKVRVKYIGEPPPEDHSKICGEYKCMNCNASSVKLWRTSGVFREKINILCRQCAENHEEKPKGDDDRIGWLIPAVPTPDGSSFWQYASVPAAAVDWWKSLPEWPNHWRCLLKD